MSALSIPKGREWRENLAESFHRPALALPAEGKDRDPQVFARGQIRKDPTIDRPNKRSEGAASRRCGGLRPARLRKVVVLPAPLRPSSATISPLPTVKLTSRRMCANPYPALRCSTSKSGVDATEETGACEGCSSGSPR